MGDVGVAGGVDDALGKDGLPARLVLGDHALDDTRVDHGINGQTVQERHDASFLDEPVGDKLEWFPMQGLASSVGLGGIFTHLPGELLELEADALDVDGSFVAVPGYALDPYLGDGAAKATIPFHEHGANAFPGRTEGS
jgi:hypothetical protein